MCTVTSWLIGFIMLKRVTSKHFYRTFRARVTVVMKIFTMRLDDHKDQSCEMSEQTQGCYSGIINY